jgi:hypothetical protein
MKDDSRLDIRILCLKTMEAAKVRSITAQNSAPACRRVGLVDRDTS